MIEITTKSSTKVKEGAFLFGKFSCIDKFIIMNTPTLPSFHQKIFAHAQSSKAATYIFLTKNNPSCLGHDPVVAWRPGRKQSAFTLVELMGVMVVIGILASLTLGVSGAVRRQGATSQAKGEISALQAACERYYAENNNYPIGTNSPTASTTPTGATTLFSALFGAASYQGDPTNKRFFEPKLNMIYTNQNQNYFIDPWGNPYGYNSDGTNAPLIWSTAGAKSGDTNKLKWITSWPQK